MNKLWLKFVLWDTHEGPVSSTSWFPHRPTCPARSQDAPLLPSPRASPRRPHRVFSPALKSSAAVLRVCRRHPLSLCYNGLSLPLRMGMCAFISVRLTQRGLRLFFSRSRSGSVCVSSSGEAPRWSRVIWCCGVWVCCVMLWFYLRPRGADVIDAVGCGGCPMWTLDASGRIANICLGGVFGMGGHHSCYTWLCLLRSCCCCCCLYTVL